MKLNICRICEQFPPAEGGLSSGMHDLSLAQHQAGHQITIITRSAPNDLEFDDRLPFRVVRIPSSKILNFSWKAFSKIKKFAEPPDLIHTHGPSAFTYLIWRRKDDPPIIHTMHAVRKYQYKVFKEIPKDVNALESKIGFKLVRRPKLYSRNSWFVKKELFLEKYICRKADHVLVVAEYFKEQLKEYYGISDSKISIIYNGSKFQANGAPIEDDVILQKVQIKPEHSIILYVGRTDWVKRVHLLVQAMALLTKKYPDARLLIVGKGDQDSDLARIIEKLSLQNSVKMLGWLPHEKLPVLLKNTKCYCLPSYWEGLSKSLIEAMSMKIPVVCSANPSHREILNDGRLGLLVEEPTPENWAQSIEKILKNEPEIVERAEKASIILDEKYRWDHVVQRINGAYQKLLDKHAKK